MKYYIKKKLIDTLMDLLKKSVNDYWIKLKKKKERKKKKKKGRRTKII